MTVSALALAGLCALATAQEAPFPGSGYSADKLPKPIGSLSELSSYKALSAEIISIDPSTGFLLSTANTQVEFVNISNPASPVWEATYGFAGVFDAPNSVGNVSSVAADPLGRGFAAAALIGTDDTGAPGKLVLFDTSTGAVLNAFDAGYHPDCVAFSHDGRYVVTANEGEWNSSAQTMGSVSVLDLGEGAGKAGLSSLTQQSVMTVDFSEANLAEGVSLAGLRVSDPSEGLPLGLEPEYVCSLGGKVYCSIQEASAIGVLDIDSGKWEQIIRMPYLYQVIDASDKDGIKIDDSVVVGMPMPDTIDCFEHEGKVYIVTANEGDFNPNDNDKARVADLGTGKYPALAPAYLAELNALYGGNALANSALGRLNVSIIDGLNASGEIELLHVPGTRSFSIIDAGTGEMVWDSGSDFEIITSLIDSAGYQDGRSDDKGPEPEGITVFEMANERYAAIVMERTYAVFLYNISDPLAPRFVDYFRGPSTHTEPECVRFLSPAQSPDGKAKLIVGYEASATISILDLATWQGFPRNPSQPNVDTLGWMGLMYVDSDWAYSWVLGTWFYMPDAFGSDEGSWSYMMK